MTRKLIETQRRKLGAFQATVRFVELHTANLGTWSVYEWELFEHGHFVDKGRFPYGGTFILVEDVIEHLHFKYVDEPRMEFACDGPSDADPGL